MNQTASGCFLSPNLSDATAWFNQGETLANAGSYQEALTSFDKALELQPNHSAGWTFKGVVLIHLERYADALASCDRALSLRSDNREAWLFRGVALHHLHRYTDAYASYDKALNIRRQSLLQQALKNLKQVWQSLQGSRSHLNPDR